MYFLKEGINPEKLEEYGFVKGNELPDKNRMFCGREDEEEDYWLVSMSAENQDKHIDFSEDSDEPVWSIQVNDKGRLWIDCLPNFSYHIDSFDMEKMFTALYYLIKDGLVEDRQDKEEAQQVESKEVTKLTNEQVLALRACKGKENGPQLFFNMLEEIYSGDERVLKSVRLCKEMRSSIDTVVFPNAATKAEHMFYEWMDDLLEDIGYTK